MSSQDRQVLSEAYKTGVIAGWKRAGDDGYRLTHGDRRDEFVATADLGRYLAKVRGRA